MQCTEETDEDYSVSIRGKIVVMFGVYRVWKLTIFNGNTAGMVPNCGRFSPRCVHCRVFMWVLCFLNPIVSVFAPLLDQGEDMLVQDPEFIDNLLELFQVG